MRRIYRNPDDQMIAGVCSGIGEYLNVDPTTVRLAFLVLLFARGGGLLVYLVMWIIMPAKPAASATTVDVQEKVVVKAEKKAPVKVQAKIVENTPAKTEAGPAAKKPATTVKKPTARKTNTTKKTETK